jgi:hypothetical protein
MMLALLAAGCGGRETGGGESTGAAPQHYRDWGCPLCHGDDRQGSELGPALGELAEAWDVERLAAYLGDPEAFRLDDPRIRELQTYYPEVTMPGYDRSEPERRELAAWLLTSPPE